MKTKRAFEIIYLLLNKKTLCARDLADHFEVSTRTIYRDIDALCEAGIPVYASQGRGGGIFLVDGFVLDKSLLSKLEQNELLFAMQSLQVTDDPDASAVLSKLRAIFGAPEHDWVNVDYSDWGKPQKMTLRDLKRAMLERRVISFDYYSAKGDQTRRTVEPYTLFYKAHAWYLNAYCQTRQAPRLFKLSRIRNLNVKDENFEARRDLYVKPSTDFGDVDLMRVVLHVDASMAFRVYDEFDDRDIIACDESGFTLSFNYPKDDWIYGLLLSFGPHVEVIEPAFLREKICSQLRDTLARYDYSD